MKDRLFQAEQCVRAPRAAVFAFFSDPRNLEEITPPWLRFRIVHQSTPQLEQGTEFEYELRIRGLPARWRSRIDEWKVNERFVDVQLRGPYARWHHTHTFEDHPQGTLIRDEVRYRLPLGRLGDLLAGAFVAADVRRIFEYRRARTDALLSRAASVPP